MKFLFRSFLACFTLLSLSVVAAEQPRIQTLPINRVVMAEKDGQVKIASENGRFVFKGVLVDNWAKRDILTMGDAARAFNFIELPDLDGLKNELQPYTYGSGKTEVTMFTDPYCNACSALLDQLTRERFDITLNLVPIAVLGDESITRVKNLVCAKDQKAAAKQLISHNYSDLEQNPSCSMELHSKRIFAAQALGVQGIPFLIRQDGFVSRGAPQLGFAAWING